MKLAIDFGTTNTVVAGWEQDAIKVLRVEEMSNGNELIPSLVYVGQEKIAVGQSVLAKGLDCRQDNRLFRNFKRGIVTTPAPEPRRIDGNLWSFSDVGRYFMGEVLQRLPEVEQLVLTAPVAAFDGYIAWLHQVVEENHLAADNIHIVDESTAAALGYAVTEPGMPVLVFDFGGGTLDLSLVQLPESKEKTGGILGFLRRSAANQHAAQVIAKAGQFLGGSDIDQWLLAELLNRCGLSAHDLGSDYAPLLAKSEQAKIALSTQEKIDIVFQVAGKQCELTLTRADLEALLQANGFYAALRRCVDKVLVIARQRGIFKEDVHAVLLVGGISLIPSVQANLQAYFPNTTVYAHKPFTAVVEGALQVAAGYGLQDYLVHSYGLRYLTDAEEHEYDEIIQMGSPYPSEPVEVILGAAYERQKEVEFVIGEIDTDAVAMVEVQYEDGQAVFVAKADRSSQQIIPLNPESNVIARLKPAGKMGDERLKAVFQVDENRLLRVTVTDMKTQKTLLNNAALTIVK